MFRLSRKILSQNFLCKRPLVADLVARSSIVSTDLVLEIGPGKGIITEFLAKQVRQVVAIEIDPILNHYLRQRFQSYRNVQLYQGDFLHFQLPKSPYKVFANIPFSIEGRIVRKLLNASNPPEDCYLVMNNELANRLSRQGYVNQFTVVHKPFFDFSILHTFDPHDFVPVPQTRAVLLRFVRRNHALLSWSEREAYMRFVEIGFGHGGFVLHNLQGIFGRERTLLALNHVGSGNKRNPTELTLSQWVALYHQLANR